MIYTKNRLVNPYFITGMLAIAALVVSYCFLDKPLVLYFHALGSRRYRVLDYMQKFPEGFKVLLPFVLLWLMYRWYTQKLSVLDYRLFLGAGSLVLVGLVKDPLKFVFARYWPAPVHGESISLIGTGDYGFTWFHWDELYRSFPSGHAAAVFAVAVILWRCFPRLRWGAVLMCCCVVIGMLGYYYHFLSDVIAGALVGILAGKTMLALGNKVFGIRECPL
ncbi:MAG: phosphatase PAP2 family protein [bacterium]|nr:phosphatase PAP2 family protein [bacterium]